MPTALPRPSIRRLVWVPFAGWLGVCAPGGLSAQANAADSASGRARVHLSGVVLDRQGDAPLSGASLLLLRAMQGERVAVAEADSAGSFVFPPVEAGPYVLSIQRIGYRDLVQDVELAPDAEIELTASMVPEAVDLEPLVVTVERRTSAVLREFEARRSRGVGTFITRAQVEERRAMLVSDLFRMVPGMRVVGDRYGGNHLMWRGNCSPKVYIDGVATVDGISIDLGMRPMDVEGIEIYSNATAPVEYAREACGVVLLWTRVPERTNGRTAWWKAVLLIGGLFGGLNLIR